MRRKAAAILFLLSIAVFLSQTAGPACAASRHEAAMARWTKTETRQGSMGGEFTIKVTLYTSEYIEALMQSEAERNLWTAYELEDYKYNLLRNMNMEENIAIHIEMEQLGPTAHMAPFDEMISLWIGRTRHNPTDYDHRFNLPLQGKRDGMVFFPRYNERTGQPLIDRNMSLILVVRGAISPVINATELRFIWDVQAQDAVSAVSGSAASRLEIDRLIRRLERLGEERAGLESELDAKVREIAEINARIEELQGR